MKIQVKMLLDQLPKRTGYAKAIRERLATKGVDLPEHVIYQSVYRARNGIEPFNIQVIKELIQYARDYQQQQKDLAEELNQIIGK